MEKAREGFAVWLTGLPCSGKSTIAGILAGELESRRCPVEVFDGDVVRRWLTRGLTFSREDRDENVRRIGFVSQLLTKHGVGVIVAAISPYRAVRDEVRSSIKNFVEIYVGASVDTCIRRDVKGMYKRALAGELKHFTGIDDPYEPPLRPDLVLDTESDSPMQSAARVLWLLEERNLVSSLPADVSSQRGDGAGKHRVDPACARTQS